METVLNVIGCVELLMQQRRNLVALGVRAIMIKGPHRSWQWLRMGAPKWIAVRRRTRQLAGSRSLQAFEKGLRPLGELDRRHLRRAVLSLSFCSTEARRHGDSRYRDEERQGIVTRRGRTGIGKPANPERDKLHCTSTVSHTLTGLAFDTSIFSCSTGCPPITLRSSFCAASALRCAFRLPSSKRLMRRLAALPFLVEKSCAARGLFACGCHPPPRLG